MRENILFLGIGQAGGNICEEFERRSGFNTLCINSSIGDLKTLTYVKHKFHLTNGQGANHDRDKSKQLILKDYPQILNLIDEIDKDNDIKIIFVVFAAPGGTGSGGGPLVADLLTEAFPDKTVCMITILPSDLEPFKAQYNTLMCFEDIAKVEKSGAVFILDNNFMPNKLDINKKFADYFCNFIDIPTHDSSKLKRIDENEIIEVLSAHNAAIIVNVSYKDGQNTVDSLFEAINKNIYAPYENDNKIGYLTLSLADKRIQYEKILSELQVSLGRPIDAYITNNNRNTNICCISGISFPKTRLNEINKKVMDNKDVVVSVLNNEIPISNINNDIKSLFKKPKEVKKEKNFSSILNKYL